MSSLEARLGFQALIGAFLVLLVGCGGESQVSKTPKLAQPESLRLIPRVILWEGTVSCSGRPDPDLASHTASDMELLANTFQKLRIPVVPVHGKSELRKELEASGGQPLLFVYSGHGAAREINDDRRSILCGDEPNGEVEVRNILNWVPHDVPWVTLVLNACWSAYVDVGSSGRYASVLSASTEEVSAGLVDSDRRAPTPVIRGLVDAIGDPKSDFNQDGVLSDHELYWSLARLLHRRLSPELIEDPPLPTLRRNAPSHLPLLRTGTGRVSTAPLSTTFAKDETAGDLLAELARQSVPEHFVLPHHRQDYFVWRRVPEDSKKQEAFVTELGKAGIRPLALVLDLDEARASDLARWTTFFEIYSLEADGDWVHVRRLRDERLLLTAQHPWLLSNLGRSAVLALSSDGETKVVRYTHGHPPDVTRNKRVAVCDQGEGQCFRYSKDPARK